MRRRILGLALTALVLYGVAPGVVDVLGGYRLALPAGLVAWVVYRRRYHGADELAAPGAPA